jgi:hypothetical protein
MDDSRVAPIGRSLAHTCTRRTLLAGLAVAGWAAFPAQFAAGAPAPVRPAHPRLLLDPPTLARLKARQAANDASWRALKTRADALATYRVLKYEYDTRTDEQNDAIFYDYQGEGWLAATMPLALAFQITGDGSYSAKLVELADELLRAQTDPHNQPPTGVLPLQVDDYYPTRNLGPVLGIIFDWCYDALGSDRRAKLVGLMNAYFDDLRANAYERNDHASGNYLPGHLLATATMGYASFGDNPRAQELIDWARIRFDGTPSPRVAADNVPDDTVDQLFAGGFKPEIARDYNGPAVATAPALGGFPVQGWAYGSETFARLIDYLLMVRSATGEDLLTPHLSWFSQILRAQKSSLLPNRFLIDPVGDWGGDQGAVILRLLPARLAHVLAGTADGPGAQHFAVAEIAESTIPDVTVYPLSEWEDFLYADPTRPSAELTLPPYYTGFGPAYPRAGATNGARPYFLVRSGWKEDATWAALNMGCAWYDDHQHADAGSLIVARGGDFLLVDAGSWKGDAGSSGVVGSSTEEDNAAAANTLWFDDFGEFQRPWIGGDNRDPQYAGGQAIYGKDEVVAAELTDGYAYVRSDLSTAYNRSGDPADQVDRKLDHFYRSVCYVRAADLFVVYDQTAAKPSSNPRGPYRRQLRWHLPDKPTVAGARAAVEQGASRLQIDTLLPARPTIAAVDESHNPDPCDGVVTPCTPYEDWQSRSGTWRLEVRDPREPLALPFLTVLQPGAKGDQAGTPALVTAKDGTMVGARVVRSDGTATVVLVNADERQVPNPVTAVSYDAGDAKGQHVLCGLQPGASYDLSVAGSVVTIQQRDGGKEVASPAGVLQVALPS